MHCIMNYIKWDGNVSKKFEFILEWTATVLLIAGVTLTAWNVYPENIYLSIAGNFAWLLVALIWKKMSLITIQGVVLLIYITGLFSKGLI